MRKLSSTSQIVKSVFAFLLIPHNSIFGQSMPNGCVLVEPVKLVLINDKHQANYTQTPFASPYCVHDEVAVAELCLPIGIVAGDIFLDRKNGLGIVREEVLPGITGPNCKVVKSYVRPNHAGTAPNYQCLSRAVAIINITLSPLQRVAICTPLTTP